MNTLDVREHVAYSEPMVTAEVAAPAPAPAPILQFQRQHLQPQNGCLFAFQIFTLGFMKFGDDGGNFNGARLIRLNRTVIYYGFPL